MNTAYRLCLGLAIVAGLHAAAAEEATGIVYDDRNGNATRDNGEPGVAAVGVSNGVDVVQTDSGGRYTLPVTDDCALFVIKPAGWQVPLNPDTKLPQHYYLHKPAGSPKLRFAGVEPTGDLPASVDFALCKTELRERFKMISFGDTQTRDREEVRFIAHDLLEELAGTDAAFGVTLGDISFDGLHEFEPLAQAIGLLGLPWYNVLGNHDRNSDAKTLAQSDETFEQVFGPSHYAYNYGKVHFIVFNDIWPNLVDNGYTAAFGEDQLAFAKNDLALVPKDHLVVMMMHIPIMEAADRAELFALLAEYPHTFSLSAHTHTHEHCFVGAGHGWQQEQAHHHLIHGTACGCWWSGNYDELGIPHTTMADGVPNGYSIIDFDGNRYTPRYKAARRPADYQMDIHAPDKVAVDNVGKAEVVVNVFDASERSAVEMRVGNDGAWKAMERFTGVPPYTAALKAREQELYARLAELEGIDPADEDAMNKLRGRYRKLVGRPTSISDKVRHLWRAKLPAGVATGWQLIHVRSTDLFGQVHQARRAIRVK